MGTNDDSVAADCRGNTKNVARLVVGRFEFCFLDPIGAIKDEYVCRSGLIRWRRIWIGWSDRVSIVRCREDRRISGEGHGITKPLPFVRIRRDESLTLLDPIAWSHTPKNVGGTGIRSPVFRTLGSPDERDIASKIQ